MSSKKIIRLAIVLVVLAVAGTTTLISEFEGPNGAATMDPDAALESAVRFGIDLWRCR